MGLIKVAYKRRRMINPNFSGVVQNEHKDKAEFKAKDAAALAVGASTSFAGKEAIDHLIESKNLLKEIPKMTLPQKYVSRLGSVALGTIGTIGTYKLLNKSKSKNE